MKLKRVPFLVLTMQAGMLTNGLCCMPAPPSEYEPQHSPDVMIGTVEGWRDRTELEVDVSVIEVLKGDASKNIVAISPCRLPLKRGERVVVVRFGEKFSVHPAKDYETVYRKTLRSKEDSH